MPLTGIRFAIFITTVGFGTIANAQFNGCVYCSVGGGSNIGTQASRSQPLLNSLGVVTHLPNGGVYSAANVISDMAFLGLNRIREQAEPITTPYNTVAAAGIKFDLLAAGFGCGGTAASAMTSFLSQWDGLVAATAGSIIAIEGLNEINNDNPCYLNTQATSSTTASGNATLHFSATMPSVISVATGGYGSQMVITRCHHTVGNPCQYYSVVGNGTTVVMSANAAGAGVGSGDTIQFQAAGAYPNNNANGVAWQTDIFNGVHGDTNLAGVPVLNMTGCCSPVGVAGTFDYNTMHDYPIFGTQFQIRFQLLLPSSECW